MTAFERIKEIESYFASQEASSGNSEVTRKMIADLLRAFQVMREIASDINAPGFKIRDCGDAAIDKDFEERMKQ